MAAGADAVAACGCRSQCGAQRRQLVVGVGNCGLCVDRRAESRTGPSDGGPGRTLHFHATDTAPEAAAEWVVDLTGEAITWRRTHEKAAVAVRGPLTELLLVLYRRRPARSEGVEILGDAELLDFWLERVGFG